MIEVMIDSVRVNLMSPQRLVILREVGSDRYLPIWVGSYEAEAITVGLQEIEKSRPLTHDLMKDIFTVSSRAGCEAPHRPVQPVPAAEGKPEKSEPDG